MRATRSARRRVAAAEQRRVHEQREQLVELDALLVAGREREALLVGGEEVPAGRAEQPQHRQVDLAVPAVGRRVDQPRAAVASPQHVAAPQVAVQARGRLGRAGELGDALADALDRPVAEAGEAGVREQRQQPPLGVERGPVRRRVVRQARAGPSRRRPRRVAAAPPNSSAPAAWISARPAPNAAPSPRPPSSTQSSTSTSSRTPSTSGTRSPPGSASQRRPAASAAYSPGATSARVLTNANDSSANWTCRPR